MVLIKDVNGLEVGQNAKVEQNACEFALANNNNDDDNDLLVGCVCALLSTNLRRRIREKLTAASAI